jgi:hypothetical protein
MRRSEADLILYFTKFNLYFYDKRNNKETIRHFGNMFISEQLVKATFTERCIIAENSLAAGLVS